MIESTSQRVLASQGGVWSSDRCSANKQEPTESSTASLDTYSSQQISENSEHRGLGNVSIVTTEYGRQYDLEKGDWIKEPVGEEAEIDPRLIQSFSGHGQSGKDWGESCRKGNRSQGSSSEHGSSSHGDERTKRSKKSGSGRSSDSDRRWQDTEALKRSGVYGRSKSIVGTDHLFLLGQEFIRVATAKAGGHEDLLSERMSLSEELKLLNILLDHREAIEEVKRLQSKRRNLQTRSSRLRDWQEDETGDEASTKKIRKDSSYELEREHERLGLEFERQIREKVWQITDRIYAEFGGGMAIMLYDFLRASNNKIDFDKIEKRSEELQILKAVFNKNQSLQDEVRTKGIQSTNVVTADVIFNFEIDGSSTTVLMPAYRQDKRIFTVSDMVSLSKMFVKSEFELVAMAIDKNLLKEEAMSQSQSSHEDFEDGGDYKNHSERALAGYLWEDAEKISNRVKQRLSLTESGREIVIESISVDIYSTRSPCNYCEAFLSRSWGEIARNYAVELIKCFSDEGQSVKIREAEEHRGFIKNSIVKTMSYTQVCDLNERGNHQSSRYFDIDDESPRFFGDAAFFTRYIKEEEAGIGKDNYRWPPRTFFVSQPTGAQLHDQNSVYQAVIKPSQEASARAIVSRGIQDKWRDLVTAVSNSHEDRRHESPQI